MTTDQLQTTRNQVVALLAAHGWQSADGAAIACKEYETAVGRKTANAYLGQLRPETENFLLTGDYWSEGRNVLDPAITLIAKAANGVELQTCVDRFAKSAETFIGQSYAVKLLSLK